MRRIILITTGGTIEKTYDESTGELANRHSIVRKMLGRLRLEDTEVSILELMHKDSLLLTPFDRAKVVDVVRTFGAEDTAGETTGIVVLHGTDTLHETGELLFSSIPSPQLPIVLTGALRPYEMKKSDALQNLTEAIFAAGLLSPGVYCVAHGRVLPFPGVVKDRARGTFVRS
ncbi:MAG: asparaginase [Candidatus Eisenbacteria bacterium]|uniref:Asparaginase n=1 Tax=Eiseniibacteriota bacterium TaxID=2212470 RepID=A0A956NEC4_UNCEI|nr:asparaginase [Candidatus Eisenbacteria bacterium]MCB9466436.1 asparaginase [Candidatus Eisenbacteria bacterium]